MGNFGENTETKIKARRKSGPSTFSWDGKTDALCPHPHPLSFLKFFFFLRKDVFSDQANLHPLKRSPHL
jgi:hypothetical protein